MFREMKFVFLSLCLSVLGCAEKKTETQTPVERSKYLVTVIRPRLRVPVVAPFWTRHACLPAIRKMLRILQHGVRGPIAQAFSFDLLLNTHG